VRASEAPASLAAGGQAGRQDWTNKTPKDTVILS